MKIRIVAVVKDEEVLLPVFLEHYSRFADSIVLWDNGSSDRTLEIARTYAKVEIRTFTSPGFDHESVFRVLGETRRESVGRFDWCIFPDCDELIVARQPGRERDLLERSTVDVVAPKGFCLVQKDGDPPFHPSKDILIQRRSGFYCPEYSKPIIVRPAAKMEWKAGRHELVEGHACTDERSSHLLLLHLDMVDFNLWLRRKMRPISPRDRALKYQVRRWDRPRQEYDKLWADYLEKTVDLNAELPERLVPDAS